ncbi:hypothetical protein BN14_02266 [Rhizoctonia solani AG-1 IB]|uniref:Uncharacterized protein n=1 Tax=Thanatephorus cucumeris (strain AG1-IB / isolate 7/3/14) TaxID=1108050 RepID=M5BMW0_THACB|nr:hypothetical protein BN14_02266 [Rhizoctonia solani AG-1 IB]
MEHNETWQDTDSEATNTDTGQRSEKLLGKRRERASPTISNPQTQEEDSLTDRDADWEPEDVEVGIPSTPGSASKFSRDEEAVAKAQVAIDKCAGRGQSYSCEQPQGRQCNIIYKQRRAKERARAKESQEAETEAEAEAEAEEVEGSDKEKDIEVQPKLEEGAQEVQREEEDEQAGKEENKE